MRYGGGWRGFGVCHAGTRGEQIQGGAIVRRSSSYSWEVAARDSCLELGGSSWCGSESGLSRAGLLVGVNS